MWHGATVRSPHPHARIWCICVATPRGLPKARSASRAADIPGPQRHPAPRRRLADPRRPTGRAARRRAGGPGGGPDPPRRRAGARRAWRRSTSRLPPVLDLDAAERAAAALPSSAWRAATSTRGSRRRRLVVEGEYRTGHQEHIYIECQGMIAWFEDDGSGHRRRLDAVPVLRPQGAGPRPRAAGREGAGARLRRGRRLRRQGGLPERCSPSTPRCSARACGRPGAAWSTTATRTSSAPPSATRRSIRHRAGVTRDGRLLALDIEILMDGGAYTTLSPVVLSRGRRCTPSAPTAARTCASAARVLRTHTAPNGAFRGFGAPQVAVRHGAPDGPHRPRPRPRSARDPAAQRARARRPAAHRPGARRQHLGPRSAWKRRSAAPASARAGGRLEAARARRHWTASRCAGIGLSLFFHGAGFTGNGERRMQSPVTARAPRGRPHRGPHRDDRHGPGLRRRSSPRSPRPRPGSAAEDVVFAEPDTAEVPDSGPTVASRTTMIVGGLIARAVAELRERVSTGGPRATPASAASSRAAPGWRRSGLPFREAARRYREEVGPLEITLRHEPPEWQRFDESTYRGAAYPTYAWGADVVEVEVDPDTLAVRPVACHRGLRGGPRHPPDALRRADRGRHAPGAGLGADGGGQARQAAATSTTAWRPTSSPPSATAPPIDVHLLEQPWEGGPFGAKGVGELPMDGGAPATAQAIENATGIVRRPPSRPRRSGSSPGGGRPGGGAAVDDRVACQVNGRLRGARRPSDGASARRAARTARPHRHQGGLRRGRVRRLHRA